MRRVRRLGGLIRLAMDNARILSCFDGGSGGNIAADSLGWNVTRYWASELDKFAIQQTQANFPNAIQLGDVKRLRAYLQAGCAKLLKIQPTHKYYFLAGQCIEILTFGVDMLCGGSPCQGFSFAGKQLNFNDPRSKLFFEFVKIKNLVKPKYFFLENVKMKREYEAVISKHMGVLPIEINAALVSAQNRVRLYWTNIRAKEVNLFGDLAPDIKQPADRKIYLKDILQRDSEVDLKYYQGESWIKWFIENQEFQLKKGYCSVGGDKSITLVARMYASWNGQFIIQRGRGNNSGGVHGKKSPTITSNSFKQNNVLCLNPRSDNKQTYQQDRVYDIEGKSPCLTNQVTNIAFRRLTPRECMRLQGWPETIKQAVSDSQIYKILGNGWQNDVVTHIWEHIDE